MPCITTCTYCGSLYEAGSEEQANERDRQCHACRPPRRAGRRPTADERIARAYARQERAHLDALDADDAAEWDGGAL